MLDVVDVQTIKDKIPLYIKRVADVLVENDYEAYLVGGSVRDLLLGENPKDYDIATNANPDQIQKLFSKTVATGAKFGTMVVVMEDENNERFNVEVTTYRSESDYYGSRWPSKVEFAKSIDEDLKRRDFTINALAIDLDKLDEQGVTVSELILDLFQGMQDLDNGLIRAVGDPIERFKEDGLRPVRACRLASQLGFEIEEQTINSIPKILDVVEGISIERFREEFLKILYRSPKPSLGIDLLRQTGIIKLFIPELIQTIGVEQPEYHADDVYTHTLKTVDNAQDEVKLAAFFHDLAKPLTISHDEKGTHFYQHDIQGAKLAEKVMRRLRFPNMEIEKVRLLVRHHMFYYPSADWRKQNLESSFDKKGLGVLDQERQHSGGQAGGWSDAAIRRFIINLGGMENVQDLFKLRIADATANPKSQFSSYEIDALQSRISEVLQDDAALKVEDLDINGHDLMNIGVKPGKQMGQILKELLDEVLENPNLNDRQKLLDLVKAKYL